MRNWMAAAVTAMAFTLGGLAEAVATDLYERDAPTRRYSAYEDPRYADIYGRTPPPVPLLPERRYYGEGYGHPPPGVPIPRERVYREYDAPPAHRRHYADLPPRHHAYAAGRGCTPKDEVRFRLEQEGWIDLHGAEVGEAGSAYVKARRRSGRLFELQIDRCSGDVLHARPLELRERPYADYAAPRWRY
jgi:hypothetical protein